MFLTGFDAPKLNTLFVDKNLRFHGLIQAFSRTNRIFMGKTAGNIVTFYDLEEATKEAIKLFGNGNSNTSQLLLERSLKEYVEGFEDSLTGEYMQGFVEAVQELHQEFGDPSKISTDSEKRQFVKTFGECLKLDDILQNYDEYADLQRQVQDISNDCRTQCHLLRS